MKMLVGAAMFALANVAGAHAAEMPRALIDNWCDTYNTGSTTVYVKHHKKCRGDLVISKNNFGWEDTDCQPLTIDTTGKLEWMVTAKCKDYGADTVSTDQYKFKRLDNKLLVSETQQ